MKVYCSNKSVNYNYFILEKYECGISLKGSEVVAIKHSKCSMRDSYCDIKDGQMYLKNMHISIDDQGGWTDIEPCRDRVLLLHKNEILKLFQKVQQQGLTIVPVKVYIPDGSNKIKVEIALVKGKHMYDKRVAIAERDCKRRIEKELRK